MLKIRSKNYRWNYILSALLLAAAFLFAPRDAAAQQPANAVQAPTTNSAVMSNTTGKVPGQGSAFSSPAVPPSAPSPTAPEGPSLPNMNPSAGISIPAPPPAIAFTGNPTQLEQQAAQQASQQALSQAQAQAQADMLEAQREQGRHRPEPGAQLAMLAL